MDIPYEGLNVIKTIAGTDTGALFNQKTFENALQGFTFPADISEA